MGERCGDDALCSGMGAHCGDRSECSGSSTTCGASSVCTGIGSVCGPGSQCSGLGTRCAGGSAKAAGGQWQQQSSSKKKSHDSWGSMKWKPMKWKPMKEEAPAHVYVHGCDQGEVCSGRPGAAQSNGVTMCCKAGCQDCEASTSQSNDVLTGTCVCNDPKPAAAPAPAAPAGPKVNAQGCETGSVCQGRPGAAEANGMAFCCPDHCSQCNVFGQESGGVLTAMCMCDGQALAEEPASVPVGPSGALPPSLAIGLAASTILLSAVVVGRRALGERPEGRQPLLA